MLALPRMPTHPVDPEHGYQSLARCDTDHEINQGRETLNSQGEMAVAQLCGSALKHAAETITHADEKLISVFGYVTTMDKQQYCGLLMRCREAAAEMWEWMLAHRLQAILLVFGLGGTAYKAKTIAKFMEASASGFIAWGKATTTTKRFFGFVGLMIARLGISTLVPPTSPGFGIILQAATPESEKWTAMPLFLAASTVAGAIPYVFDKVAQIFVHEDFVFTRCMKRFVDAWPLTCWTAPAMREVFKSAGGGKMGASLAVIVAHAAPFMGAQTTIIQRYFLPHPLDTIISQPFGMSEDLLGMAVAEGASNPFLASVSLTVLIVAFNMLQFLVVSNFGDFKAYMVAVCNFAIGGLVAYIVSSASSLGQSKASTTGGLLIVLLQFLTQLFAIPMLLSSAERCAHDPVTNKFSPMGREANSASEPFLKVQPAVQPAVQPDAASSAAKVVSTAAPGKLLPPPLKVHPAVQPEAASSSAEVVSSAALGKLLPPPIERTKSKSPVRRGGA